MSAVGAGAGPGTATRKLPEGSAQPCEPGDSPEKRAAHRLVTRALWAILAVALVVRLWGLDWQLPWQFHPDEGHYTWKAMDLISQQNLNPKYFRNPSLQTYLFLAEYRLLGFQPSKTDEQAATADGWFRPPSGVAFVGRLTVAIMGALNVVALAWTARAVCSRGAATLGALFLALAFIHVRDSHYATNDVLSVLLLTLSVGFSARVSRYGMAAYVAAGLCGGLAASVKYNAGLFVVPLLVAHAAIMWRSLRWRDPRAHLVPLGAAGLVAIVAYLAGTPYTILDFPKWLADFRTQSSFVDEAWEGQAKLAPGMAYVQALVAGLGLPMLLLAVYGAVERVRLPTYGRPVLALLSFPVVYLLFMSRSELFFVRFALPLVPFVCLFAGIGVWAIWRRVQRQSGDRVALLVGAALTILTLVQPTLDTIRHNLLIAKPDTRVLAAEWALQNVPKGAKMAVEEYTIRDRRPRAYGGPVWQLDTDLLDVNQLRRADPTAPLRGSTRYFMISSFQQDRFSGGPDSPQRQFYDALAREGRMVARFAPGVGGESLPFDLEDLYSPFWSLSRYERPGPTITVYELPGY